MTDTDRAAYTTALRDIADWLDNHPEVPLPSRYLWIRTYINPKVTLANTARAMPGKVTKVVDEDSFGVTATFGPITVSAKAYREDVCERVQVGTRRVESQVPVGDVQYQIVIDEEPVYEYVCPDSLLRPDSEAVGA